MASFTAEEYERLIDDARREYDEQAAATQLQFGNLMLDANAHPEFAAEQFRILVAQLDLLLKAAGEDVMRRNLGKVSAQDSAEMDVLHLLAQRQPK